MNYHCYTGVKSCEFHIAKYEPDSFYENHLDNFRKFTVETYLNENWKKEDEGELIMCPMGMSQ